MNYGTADMNTAFQNIAGAGSTVVRTWYFYFDIRINEDLNIFAGDSTRSRRPKHIPTINSGPVPLPLLTRARTACKTLVRF